MSSSMKYKNYKAKIIKCKRIVFHGGYAPEEKGNIIQKNMKTLTMIKQGKPFV